MGVDLTLMPLMTPQMDVSHELIEVERRQELWPEIARFEKAFGRELTCFRASDDDGESCYGKITKTPYGDALTYVAAGDIVSLRHLDAVQDNWRNRGVWALLSELPKDWPVVLFWH